MEGKMLFVFMTVVIAAANAQLVLDEATQKILTDCAAQTDVDLEKVFEAAKSAELPTSENGKCYIDCVMTKAGVLNGDKVNIAKAKEIGAMHLADNPDLKEKAEKVVDMCVAEVSSTGGKCEFAIALLGCALKRGKEMGIPHPEIIL